VFQQFFVNDSFAIIRNYDPVVLRRIRRNEVAYFPKRSAIDGSAAFAVETNDLLMMRTCDDPTFLNGLKLLVRNDTGGRRTRVA